MEPKKWKNKSFLEALCHSLDGIKYAIQTERSLKIELVLTVLAIGLGIFLELSLTQFAILFLTIGIVLLAELLNTAIEVMLDLYSQEYNENIKLAKDISSGAVLITSIMSVMVAAVVLLPKIVDKLI